MKRLSKICHPVHLPYDHGKQVDMLEDMHEDKLKVLRDIRGYGCCRQSGSEMDLLKGSSV